MLYEPKPYLPRVIVDNLKADPSRWLLKARSPLVKWATYTCILEWPEDHPEVRTYKALIHEDDDFARITRAQRKDGTWSGTDSFPESGLFGAYYSGTVWQLPLLADLQFKAGSAIVDKAFDIVLRSLTADGFIDLTSKGIPVIRANAVACGAFLDMGYPRSEIQGTLNWLCNQQRSDGGWADFYELKHPDFPSSVKTTAAVLYALRTGVNNTDTLTVPIADRGSKYLMANLFGDYQERFPRSKKAWGKLSWPQYNFDILSVGRAMQICGYGAEQLEEVTKAIVAKQTHRGYWRQEVLIIAPTHIRPVTTSRASRWLTFKATRYLVDLHK